MMPQNMDMSQDIVAIKEWLAKEPYLPQDLEDLVIRKFLHSCYGSLERTKKCIDRFCSGRSMMPELYTSRDPTSTKMQTAFAITCVTTYKAGEQEILIHRIDDPNLEKFNFYDVMKSLCIQADYWLKYTQFFPDGHTIIFDMKDITLKVIAKVNVMYLRDFLLFLLEGMPVRVKQVHVVNCPSYYDKLYALIKPVLPAEICNLINFHPEAKDLHNLIDKKYLPKEYGGEAETMYQQQNDWVSKIIENKKTFLDGNMWKADLKKKPKNNSTEKSMSGSFKTLSID